MALGPDLIDAICSGLTAPPRLRSASQKPPRIFACKQPVQRKFQLKQGYAVRKYGRYPPSIDCSREFHLTRLEEPVMNSHRFIAFLSAALITAFFFLTIAYGTALSY